MSQVQEVLIMRHESLRTVTMKMTVFCCATPCTLKENKIIPGFSQTQQYILLYCYLDGMFRSFDHHQVILVKLRSKVHGVQIAFM
jgi:hypothetical protein